MTQFKGTPGPWEIKPEEVDRPYIRIRGTQWGRRFKIANVLSPNYDGVHHREANETRANACLIAAAPELLEALRDLQARACIYVDTSKAKAVINKATGEIK